MNPIIYEEKSTVLIPEVIRQDGITALLTRMRILSGMPFGSAFQPPANWSWTWVNDEGKFATRVSKLFYEDYHISLTEMSKSEIAATWQYHNSPERKVTIDFTHFFDWRAGNFGDNGSCFWDGRDKARLMLENINGFAMRFWDEQNNKGLGRCWCVPAMDGYIQFNRYGMDSKVFTSAFSIYLGIPEKHVTTIALFNDGSSDGTLYVNSGAGYYFGEAKPKHNSYDLGASRDFNLSHCKFCAAIAVQPILGEPICLRCKSKGLS